MRSVQDMSETISMLSSAFGYDALDDTHAIDEQDIDDEKYPIDAYRDSFFENLEQIEHALSTDEEFDPKEALCRISASAHNLYTRTQFGKEDRNISDAFSVQEVLTQVFYDVPVEESDRERLYRVTEKLFQAHDHERYEYINLKRVKDLCHFDPKLALICADYPENISVHEMVELENEDSGLCGMIGNAIDYRHISKSGNHVVHIKPEEDEEDLIEFVFAENRNGAGFFYDLFGHSGERMEFLDPYETNVGTAEELEDEDPYYLNKLRALTDFIDFAQSIFDKVEGKKNNPDQPTGP